MANPVVLANAAVLVTRINDVSVAAGDGRPIRHGAGILVGVRDCGGALCHREAGADRYFPVARGRVDWLPAGELRALPASPPFGDVLLVELRALPDAPGVSRAFGDKILFESDTACVYEEVLGPGQVRTMHSHAPRLIIPLTGAHWAPSVMVHEIRNIGDAPFWAVCVEHP